jgi:hypothetical protein
MVSVPIEKAPAMAPSVQIPSHAAPKGPSIAVSVPKSVPAPESATNMAQSPVLPIMPQDDRAHMPRPGMPAPLPPGLDLNDQTLPPEFTMPESQ